jgi:protein-tyrosine phosphatase
MRIYPITSIKNGKLAIMARPRGNEWLTDDIRALKRLDVNLVVSLLEADEVRELQIEEEEKVCRENGIDFRQFPIRDRSIPADKKQFIFLVESISDYLLNGKHVIAHCRMGIGRASMLAAAVLIHQGEKSTNAFDIIKKCRGLDVPDTEEQKKWINLL